MKRFLKEGTLKITHSLYIKAFYNLGIKRLKPHLGALEAGVRGKGASLTYTRNLIFIKYLYIKSDDIFFTLLILKCPKKDNIKQMHTI